MTLIALPSGPSELPKLLNCLKRRIISQRLVTIIKKQLIHVAKCAVRQKCVKLTLYCSELTSNGCAMFSFIIQNHEQNIIQRDTEINTIGTKYGIRPNTNANGSLDRDSVIEFKARLGEMARAQALELERLQVRASPLVS
jgi:hypothetical protein